MPPAPSGSTDADEPAARGPPPRFSRVTFRPPERRAAGAAPPRARPSSPPKEAPRRFRMSATISRGSFGLKGALGGDDELRVTVSKMGWRET